MPSRARSAVAIALCAIAVLASSQASGIVPGFVSADNTLTVQLLRAPTSTESLSSNGTVQINLDSGKLELKLHHGTPDSVYAVLFLSASASANVQLGTFVTDFGGEGNVQGTMNPGAYVGIFEVIRLGSVQFTSANVTFTVGTTLLATSTIETTSTTSQSSSQTTQSETTTSANNSAQFVFEVDPALRSVNAGDFAKFNIHVAGNTSAEIFLVARDVPPGSLAIFTPTGAVATHDFRSTLTVVTSSDTPAGTYAVTVVALVGGQEFATQVALEVSASQSATMTVPVATTLSMTVTTDQSQYQPNSTVNVQGHLTDSTGSAVPNATVSVQVDSPTGAEVFFTSSAQTDAVGTFQAKFALSADAAVGTYSVFATASKENYSGVAARTTFVVGTSTTPSVLINTVYTGDSSGNPISTFSVGQTVWIWVVVQNNGATFQGVVWVQVRDPNGVPMEIRITITDLHAGETVKDVFGFTLSGSATLGVYRVDALVSDELISQGGSFLANAQTQFALTG